MYQQVAGLLSEESSAVEAAEMLRDHGCKASNIVVARGQPAHLSERPGLFRALRTWEFLEQPEGMWPCALRWAIWGSLLVGIPILVWVLLAFDSWGTQLFLGSTLWKLGGILGGMLGAMVGAFRGVQPEVARFYKGHLEQGSLALVVRISPKDAPFARGVLIESGAYDVRDLEGTLMPKLVARPSRPRAASPNKGHEAAGADRP